MAQDIFSPPDDWDGLYKQDSNFTTVRDATSGTSRGAIGYANTQFQDPTYTIDRTFFVWDTSALPDSINVTSATISLDGITQKVGAGVRHYAFYDTTCGDTVALADFNNHATTIQSDQLAQADLTDATATETWTLTATGEGNISTTGNTKFCLREVDKDVGNVAPTENTYWGFDTPVLTVNYDIIAPSGFLTIL